MEIAEVVGRVLLSLVFLRGGFQAARNPGGRAKKAARLKLPKPDWMVRVNGAVMVLGAAALALGLFVQIAAILLIGSLALTTLAGHPWWIEDDAGARKAQFTQFLKNTAVLGGLVLALALTL